MFPENGFLKNQAAWIRLKIKRRLRFLLPPGMERTAQTGEEQSPTGIDRLHHLLHFPISGILQRQTGSFLFVFKQLQWA